MTKIPFNKPPLTFEAQVNKLLDKGLIISNKKHAEHVLSIVNYYHLKSYLTFFQKEDRFINTRFEDVINLYLFDRELRGIVFDAIEVFEIAFRTRFCNIICLKYDTAFPHLDEKIFGSNSKQTNKHKDLLDSLKRELQHSKDKFIELYKKQYRNEIPPLWLAVELMSFGELSKWYNLLRNFEDKALVANSFGLRPASFKTLLLNLTNMRNFSAHHSRLWNRTLFSPIQIAPGVEIHSYINSNEESQNRIYNTLVLLLYVMDLLESEYTKNLKLALIEIIHKYNPKTDFMGFPNNWQTMSLWQTK